jgi:hypothetical protein
VAALAIGAILAAPIGAQFTTLLPVQLLRRTFATMLVLGAVSLIAKQAPHLSLGMQSFAASSWPAGGAPAYAPGWLHPVRHSTGFVLARRHGPRLGLLPLVTGRPSPPAPSFVARSNAPISNLPRTAQVKRISQRAGKQRRDAVRARRLIAPTPDTARQASVAPPDLLQTLYGR